MTDAEIIKALEFCSNEKCAGEKCPLHERTVCTKECLSMISGYSLDLIQRQQEEVERLKKKVAYYDSYPNKVLVGHNSEVLSKTWEDYIEFISDVAAEGVKEFADKVVKQLEAEIESSDKYIREYDDSEVQKAWKKGLRKALEIVKGQME